MLFVKIDNLENRNSEKTKVTVTNLKEEEIESMIPKLRFLSNDKQMT